MRILSFVASKVPSSSFPCKGSSPSCRLLIRRLRAEGNPGTAKLFKVVDKVKLLVTVCSLRGKVQVPGRTEDEALIVGSCLGGSHHVFPTTASSFPFFLVSQGPARICPLVPDLRLPWFTVFGGSIWWLSPLFVLCRLLGHSRRKPSAVGMENLPFVKSLS